MRSVGPKPPYPPTTPPFLWSETRIFMFFPVFSGVRGVKNVKNCSNGLVQSMFLFHCFLFCFVFFCTMGQKRKLPGTWMNALHVSVRGFGGHPQGCGYTIITTQFSPKITKIVRETNRKPTNTPPHPYYTPRRDPPQPSSRDPTM